VGVWIDIEEFYRALKIWHFDFDLEEGREENLYNVYHYGLWLRGDLLWLV
jgi:hypothetical protein